MKYIAIIRQIGEGCDYTVDCGLTFIEIECSNIKDAQEELELRIEEIIDIDEIDSCILYEVGEIVICDLKKNTPELESETDIKEREEYERLRRKFEK